jgi:hypothetical protein
VRTRKRKKKRLTWDALINFGKQKYKESNKPLLTGMKFRGAEVSRTETFDGVIRKVTIKYERGEDEILEWVGKIRIK